MALHTISFDVSAIYSAGMPKLQIKYGGIKLDTSYVGTGSTTLSFQIDSDDPFDHTLLRFYSVKNYGSPGDIINISNVKIDSNPIDLSAFTHNKGSSGDASSISLTRGSYSDYEASGELPDTVPPPAAPTPDAIITGTLGIDKLYGTDGIDVIAGLDGNDKIIAKGGDDIVNGGNGDDVIAGQDGNDILNGDAGNDTLYGNAGADTLNGGADDDRLYGHEGNDTLNGGTGNDRLYGGDNDDALNGDDGDDILSGGAGNDTLNGGLGNDQLFGGDGNDILNGGDGDDRLLGNNGDDTIYGGAGADNIDGQLGNDNVFGGDGDDTIDGEQGDDILRGEAGNDTIMGGLGSDIISGGDGNDIIHGGGVSSYDQYVIREGSAWGRSEVWYSEATNSFYMFVDTSITWDAARTAANSTLLNGASGHLVNINSQVENDFVYNMATFKGVDSSTGAGGNRIWLGGSDIAQDGVWEWGGGAEAGIQFSSGSTSTNNSFINWGGGQPNGGVSQVYGTMWFNGGADDDAWDDRNATDGHNYIIEWSGEDVQADTSANTLNGGNGDDLIYGGSGIDTIRGNADNDQIYGLGGNDIIFGDAGNDLIVAGDGADSISGGTGNDVIYGDSAFTPNIVSIYGATFDANTDGFTYADAVFGQNGDGSSNAYASGSYQAGDGGATNGSLEILLGGINNNNIATMSGAHQNNFTVLADSFNTMITFSYRAFDNVVDADPFDNGEDLHLIVDINGTNYEFLEVLGTVAGASYDSGWVTTTLNLGDLSAGSYTLSLGGLLDFKTFTSEQYSIRFDDVAVTGFSEALVGDADTISGGTGADLLYGGLGDDILYGVDATDSASSIANANIVDVYTANFDGGSEGFAYSDVSQGAYASGTRITTDGNTGNGALEITLGGVNGNNINNISGEYSGNFTLGTAVTDGTFSFAFRALNSGGQPFEANEDLQITVDIDGTTYSSDANPFFFEELDPNNNFDTGWTTVSFDVGSLGAGLHNMTFTGLVTRKTETGEEIQIRIDDIAISNFAAGTSTGTINELHGGFGADILVGSTETDHFIFESNSAFTDIDVINKFDLSELDAIDISDLLSGYVDGVSDINDFVQFTNSGANTLVQIDTDGAVGGANYQSIAQVNGLTGLNEDALLSNGNLIV